MEGSEENGEGGVSRVVHPTPLQLLPDFTVAGTVSASSPSHEVSNGDRDKEENNNRKPVYPWHALIPFLAMSSSR